MQTDPTYIRPKKAAGKLKAAREMRRTAYLYGATGIGKTALTEDVLSRRRYRYYSAKETEPEQIEVREDGKNQTIVIDDLHCVAQQERREKYAFRIEKLLDRRDIWLILISRCPIPRWLIPLHVRHVFCLIQEEDFLLSQEEQNTYLEKWAIHLTEAEKERAWSLGQGNPITLRLLALEQGNIEKTIKSMWNYLETHVYDQWDLELQEFLMETTIVEYLNPELAKMITGRSDVEHLIHLAEETGNFLIPTEKDDVWKYRWAMRQSMQQRLHRRCSAERIRQLYYNAGLYYELQNQILKALEIYKEYNDMQSISRLLIANARKNPGNGQYFQLRKYYLSLPEKMAEESPILMACLSMLQSILMNEEESERWYKNLKAFAEKHTGSMRREARSRLLYLDIGLPHRGTIYMVDIVKNVGSLLLDTKTVLPELSVTGNLSSLMNGGKDFCEWSRKDKELAASIGRVVEFVLGKYGKGIVPLALAESYFEKGFDSYEVLSLAEKGKMRAESGGKIELSFVAVGIISWLSVIGGDVEEAVDRLLGFQTRAGEDAPHLLPNISAFLCRLRLYQYSNGEAEKWMGEAPDETEEFCTLERFRYLTKVRVYLQKGKYEHAWKLLQQLLYYAGKMKRTYIEIEATLLLAVTRYRMGMEGWRKVLQQCITRAEEYHFVRVISREGCAVWELLKAGGFIWKDQEYKKQVLTECERMALQYPRYLEGQMEAEVILSENALKILRMQAEGYTAARIAEYLNITEATVKYHNKETYRKLGVNSKTAAVNEAVRRRLI